MAEEFELVFKKTDGFTLKPLPLPPTPSGFEILVRPKWVGICGSDLYLLESCEGELRPGHEWIGKVERCGPAVREFKPGDVVTSTGTLACFDCAYCRSGSTNLCSNAVYLGSDRLGALRTWMTISEPNLVKAPGALAMEQVLHELLAVAEEAVQLALTHPRASEKNEMLILGGGPVGLMIAMVARRHGIYPLMIEKRDFRIHAATKKGIETFSTSRALMEPGLASRFSLIVDATNDYYGDSGGFKYLPLFAKKGFTAVIVGKYQGSQSVTKAFNPLGGTLVWMRGISQGTLRDSVPKWDEQVGRVAEDFITHRVSIREAGAAFALAREKTDSLKVVIEL